MKFVIFVVITENKLSRLQNKSCWRIAMAKVIDRGSYPPDHPIYSGGYEIFSRHGSSPSLKSTAKSTAGETPDISSSADETSGPTFSEVEKAVQKVQELHHGTDDPSKGHAK
jgi:hypothetical protein